jgi:hypothetical protein
MTDRGDGGARVPLAFGWGGAVSVAGYALLRGFQYLVYPEPNPARMAWTPHAGYVWRMWTVGYAGGIAAFLAYVLTRSTERSARALAVVLPATALLLVAQATFLP